MPVIYTTYGIAMRHQPEVLAESGGVRSAGEGGTRDHPPAGQGKQMSVAQFVLLRLGLTAPRGGQPGGGFLSSGLDCPAKHRPLKSTLGLERVASASARHPVTPSPPRRRRLLGHE